MKYKQIDIVRDLEGDPISQTFLFEDGTLCSYGNADEGIICLFKNSQRADRKEMYPFHPGDEYFKYAGTRQFKQWEYGDESWRSVDIKKLTDHDITSAGEMKTIYKVNNYQVWKCTLICDHPTNPNYYIYLNCMDKKPFSVYYSELKNYPYFRNQKEAWEHIRHQLQSMLEDVESTIETFKS